MYKQRLKEYIDKDVIYQDYKKQKEFESSDFDNFCILHCEDIEEALFDLEQLRKENKELKELYETQTNFNKELLNKFAKKERENKELHNKIDKAIEYINNENYKDDNICVINGVDILKILRGDVDE